MRIFPSHVQLSHTHPGFLCCADGILNANNHVTWRSVKSDFSTGSVKFDLSQGGFCQFDSSLILDF